MSTLKQRMQDRLKEWQSDLEQLQVQFNLGKKEAAEEFEKQKIRLQHWLEEQQAEVKEEFGEARAELKEEYDELLAKLKK